MPVSTTQFVFPFMKQTVKFIPTFYEHISFVVEYFPEYYLLYYLLFVFVHKIILVVCDDVCYINNIFHKTYLHNTAVQLIKTE